MTIEVVRTSFFRPGDKILAYEEHSSGCKNEAHSICGCTDMVTERPEGKPEEVKQRVLFKGTHRGLEGTVSITSQETLWSTFRWDRRPEDEPLRVDKSDGGRRDHAYFMFSPGRVNLEITMPGYGLVDHFFGHIFLGNKADFSTLYNGHSPSKVVNAEKVSAGTLWGHDCSWGREAMQVFPDSREAQDWRSWFRTVEEVLAQTQHGLTEDVHGIRAALEASGVEKLVAGLQEQLATLLGDFRQTETYRLCDEVSMRVKPQRS